eukprot:7517046-Pyramimonas_sp.AAC.1
MSDAKREICSRMSRAERARVRGCLQRSEQFSCSRPRPFWVERFELFEFSSLPSLRASASPWRCPSPRARR